MPIFVLADLHLSQNLDKQMDVFGKRWAGYTEKLINGWKKVVSCEDTVVIPGDVSWGMTLQDALDGFKLLDSLPGRKIIGRGNHDFWWTSSAKMKAFLAENRLSSIDFLYNNAFLVENIRIVGTRGWYYDEKTSPKDTDFDKIVAREAGRLRLSIAAAEKLDGTTGADETICFLHFPAVYRDQICQPLLDVMKEHGIKRCYFGHIHGVYDYPSEVFCEEIEHRMISADFLNFVPQKIEPIREGNENFEGNA